MTRRQVIDRNVHGGVAGRDVFNIDFFRDCTEYEAQRLFFEKTKIDCTRQARAQLIHLAEVHDFRFTDLGYARRAGCLNWSEKDKRWTHTSRWLDYGAAAFFATFATGAALGGVAALIATWDTKNSSMYLLLVVAMLFFVLGFIKQQFVTPHRIAKRAVALLARVRVSGVTDRCAGDQREA